jgi:tetratricopeptide (TPR) repeat protein
MNVLALVNKGLALFQWKNDVRAAEQFCEEAIRIDPESEAAVATLAQLSLQQNKIDVAVKLFDKQAELARSEPELVSALTYRYVSLVNVRPQLQYSDQMPPFHRPRRRKCSSFGTTLRWRPSYQGSRRTSHVRFKDSLGYRDFALFLISVSYVHPFNFLRM